MSYDSYVRQVRNQEGGNAPISTLVQALLRGGADSASIRAHGMSLIAPLVERLMTCSDPEKEDVFSCIIWMYDPAGSTDQPNKVNVLSQCGVFKDIYTRAVKNGNQRFANNILNGLSNLAAYMGRLVAPYYEEYGIVDTVLSVAQSGKLESGSVSASMIIANSIGHEEDKAKLITKTIPQICQVVRASLDGTTYSSRGWNPKGACQALANLSIADANKTEMVKAGVIPNVISVLNKDWSSNASFKSLGANYYHEAKMLCCRILWNLSFTTTFDNPTLVENALKVFAQDESVPSQYRSVAQNAIFSMNQARNAAIREKEAKEREALEKEEAKQREAREKEEAKLREAREKEEAKAAKKSLGRKSGSTVESAVAAAGPVAAAPPPTPAPAPAPAPVDNKQKGWVMISYNWTYKPAAIAINQRLKSEGYEVWLDIERMSASTLEAMAEAVEKSSLVIMLVAAEYKQSEACRTEGEYAYSLRKKIIPIKVQLNYRPDGWLGATLGTKLYFTCGPDPNDAKFQVGLTQAINEISTIVSKEQVAAQAVATAGGSNEELATLRERYKAAEDKIRQLEAKLHAAESTPASPSHSSAPGASGAAPGASGDVNARLDKMEQMMESRFAAIQKALEGLANK